MAKRDSTTPWLTAKETQRQAHNTATGGLLPRSSGMGVLHAAVAAAQAPLLPIPASPTDTPARRCGVVAVGGDEAPHCLCESLLGGAPCFCRCIERIHHV